MAITSQEMKELEDLAESKGISKSELMEEAGRQVFLVVKEKYNLRGKQIVVFCGQGNNGGDGFVAARYFLEEGVPVTVLFFGEEQKLKREGKKNHKRIKDKVAIVKIKEKKDLEKFHFQEQLNYILIDALLGTGVKGKLREPISFGIELFNSLAGVKVGVDLPSGLDSDTGEIEDKACKCELIVCFHEIKKGLVGREEEVVVRGIGIPV